MAKISLEQIRIDGGTQIRAALNSETVDEYAEHYRNDVNLPDLVVFFDGQDHWLADGFHRYHAAKQAGLCGLHCDVRSGTQREARLYSCGANGEHGLKRTNEDKRSAVLHLLDDEEWSRWSDRVIAEKCNVSNTFVSNIRNQLSTLTTVPVIGADGKMYDRSANSKHGESRTKMVAGKPNAKVVFSEGNAVTAKKPPALKPQGRNNLQDMHRTLFKRARSTAGACIRAIDDIRRHFPSGHHGTCLDCFNPLLTDLDAWEQQTSPFVTRSAEAQDPFF